MKLFMASHCWIVSRMTTVDTGALQRRMRFRCDVKCGRREQWKRYIFDCKYDSLECVSVFPAQWVRAYAALFVKVNDASD